MKTTLDWKCGQSLEVGVLYEDSIMKYETMVEQRVFVPFGSDARKLHFLTCMNISFFPNLVVFWSLIITEIRF